MLFLDSMAGYAFAKLKFRGSHVLFVVVLISMMIPFQITMIPTYLLLNDLHILNTYAGLMIPRMTNAFGIYFMRQAFLGVPNDLLDAGRIDGLTEFGIYRKVAIPVVGASIATLAVFHFMAGWNDFMWPMLMTNSQTMQTLPVGLALFQESTPANTAPCSPARFSPFFRFSLRSCAHRKRLFRASRLAASRADQKGEGLCFKTVFIGDLELKIHSSAIPTPSPARCWTNTN